MKITSSTILCTLILLIFSSCSTYNDYLGFDADDFSIVKLSDSHGGFHGDGTLFVVLNCSVNTEKALENIKGWNKLPLPNTLNEAVFETFNHYDGVDIPYVENGYYKFVDRHSKCIDPKDSANLLNRSSYNFTIGIYDTDTNIMYYIKIDT